MKTAILAATLLALVAGGVTGCKGKEKAGPQPAAARCERLAGRLEACAKSRYLRQQIADRGRFVRECQESGDLMKKLLACAEVAGCEAFETCFLNHLGKP